MSQPPFTMSKYASEIDLLRDKCAWLETKINRIHATATLVRQEHANGCQVAVFAMVLGIGYKAAMQRLMPAGGEPEAYGMFSLHGWLADAGWAVATKWRTMQPGNVRRAVWPLEPWAELHHVEVQHSGPGIAHAVLMLADGAVLDPAHDEPRRLSDYYAVNSMSALVPLPDVPSGVERQGGGR